jgi:hypothetical protein
MEQWTKGATVGVDILFFMSQINDEKILQHH